MKMGPLVASAAVFLALASPPGAGAGTSGCHPYFPDGGTLTWYTDAADAQAAARATGRLVFIEYGRRACCNCRTLVSKYLPSAPLKDRFGDLCVGLAADCDEPDARIEALFRSGLPGAGSLPFVAFVSSDLAWVTGWAGATSPCEIAQHLTVAETWRARRAVACGPVSRPPAPTAPAPAIPAGAPAAPAARPPTGRSTPASDVESARALLVRARAAALAGRHGEVLRLDTEAARLAVRVEPAEWTALCQGASCWAEGCLCAAATAAQARKCEEAARLLAAVKREMEGRSAETEAVRGERAMARLKSVDAGPAEGKDAARAAAAKEFQGSRWAALFKG